MSKIKFGVNIDEAPEMLWHADYNATKNMAQQAELLGYTSLWVMDHFYWGKGPRALGGEGTVFEPWTLLSALAIETDKMKLGVMVSCNSFRHPSIIAKVAATIDVISNGRVIFGYGAGWFQEEYDAFGFPFLSPSVRLNQMKEAIIVIKKLWTEKRTTFQGKYYNLQNAPGNPKPIQKPYPPIMIGGGGEKLTLRIVAELADMWNLYGVPIEIYKRKVDILTTYCDALGKKITDIELTWTGNLTLANDAKQLQKKIDRYIKENRIYSVPNIIASTYDDCIGKLQQFVDIGCTHFIFNLQTFNEDKEAFMEKIAPSF
jgi:F420-dependent oxidoreductase-like protein